jgi:hypothetical protein
MNCTLEENEITPAITREDEARLYKYLSKVTDGDALRYELIAKKIQRAADGYANSYDLNIVNDWLRAMNEEAAAVEAGRNFIEPREEPFAAVRRGQVGASNYQAFLDTLEQAELDVIKNNVPYFTFFSSMQMEAKKAKQALTPEFIRNYADNHLSQRVKALRGL